VLFFPNDDSKFSQLYNFTINTLKATDEHYDTYFSDSAHLAATASVMQSIGFDFTENTWAGYNIKAENLFVSMFAPICNSCTMLNVVKLGKIHVQFSSVHSAILV